MKLAVQHGAVPVLVEVHPAREAVWRARIEARANAQGSSAARHKPDWQQLQTIIEGCGYSECLTNSVTCLEGPEIDGANRLQYNWQACCPRQSADSMRLHAGTRTASCGRRRLQFSTKYTSIHLTRSALQSTRQSQFCASSSAGTSWCVFIVSSFCCCIACAAAFAEPAMLPACLLLVVRHDGPAPLLSLVVPFSSLDDQAAGRLRHRRPIVWCHALQDMPQPSSQQRQEARAPVDEGT